jgi:hypothetical protein
MKPERRSKPKPLNPAAPRRRLEGLRIVVRHRDVKGDALEVFRVLRAADHPVVLGAAVGRANDRSRGANGNNVRANASQYPYWLRYGLAPRWSSRQGHHLERDGISRPVNLGRIRGARTIP